MSTVQDVATPTIPDLSRPSLQALSYALRHRETWPADFRLKGWYFPIHEECAMGLANTLWNLNPTFVATPQMAEVFGISQEKADYIFLGGFRPSSEFIRDTTPEMVADEIDKLLA